MAEVFTYVAIAAAFVIALPALWMLSRGLWPEGFERRVEVSRHGVFKSFLIGILPVAIISLIITIFAKRLGPIPGILISGTAFAWGLMGLVGYASVIGERLWINAEAWRQTRNGGLVLICCALLPVVGWFFLLPLFVVIGMGVSVRCMISRKPTTWVQVSPALPTE